MIKINNKDWWKEAVIYQIYLRSYQDSNGDGIGDIKGVISRLDYISELGIDAIWISPFFKSPMNDFGYDVENYKNVDPIFGTLDDFKELLDKAHKLNIKVIIDLVISHTADIHPWFVESKESKNNSKSDWYVWADPKKDGTPPNNWLSIFGGSAWHWNTTRKQYYLHNFLTSQPDLNFHNIEVQDALLDITKFWLDLGVDGFRLDTVNFYFHDNLLRDNPGLDEDKRIEIASDIANPYTYQLHLYDKTRPENIDFLKRFRKLLDTYDCITSVGEVGDSHRGLEIMADYTAGTDKIHMCYGFDFLNKNTPTPDYIQKTVTKYIEVAKESWASWSFSNHDTARYATRWEKDGNSQQNWLKMLATILLTIKGTPCLYQGEELGLKDVDVKFKDLQDPYGIEFWPKIKSRDGCRTPMVWDSLAKNAGFSTADKCWLPVDDGHLSSSVSKQKNKQDSLLEYYKNLINIRKTYKSLQLGEIEFINLNPDVLSFYRVRNKERLLCVFNFSDQEQRLVMSEEYKYKTISELKYNSIYNNENFVVKLAPYGVWLTETKIIGE